MVNVWIFTGLWNKKIIGQRYAQKFSGCAPFKDVNKDILGIASILQLLFKFLNPILHVRDNSPPELQNGKVPGSR